LQDKLDRAQLAEITVSARQVAHRPRAVNADATGVLVAHARRSLRLARRDATRRAEYAPSRARPSPSA